MFALGILGAACAAAVVGWAVHLNWDIVLQGDNDFASFYAGGKLAGTPELYSAEATVRAQAEFARVKPSELFVRPAFYAVLLKPLTRLPYRAAYAVFVALNACALVSFLAIFARRDPLLWLVGGVSMPALTALVLGQDILLLVFVCGVAAMLARREWRFAAGLALSLCAVKFHLFLLIPPLLLVHKEWRSLAGVAAGTTGLSLIGVAAQGWKWPAAYLDMLRNPSIHPMAYLMPNLHGIVSLTLGDRPAIEAILAALASALALYAAAKAPTFEFALAVSLLAGLFVSHADYIHDCCMLIPVAVFGGRSALRTGALILLAPPFYFLLGAGAMGMPLPLGMLVTLVIVAMELGSGKAASGEADSHILAPGPN